MVHNIFTNWENFSFVTFYVLLYGKLNIQKLTELVTSNWLNTKKMLNLFLKHMEMHL